MSPVSYGLIAGLVKNNMSPRAKAGSMDSLAFRSWYLARFIEETTHERTTTTGLSVLVPRPSALYAMKEDEPVMSKFRTWMRF